MITGFLTFIFFFAIVGCILYGRKLIKRERVDAVFGNPERAKGGIHWVIVGSSFLLLIWLYYSWDIAKSFFPRSANELCQVGKVNESLMSLKYLFPIDERQLKSTSVIETETENLNKIIFEIKNSEEVSEQNKGKLLNFITETKNTIPLLTSEKLLSFETKENIRILTERINTLSIDFVRDDYSNESDEERIKRIQAAGQEGTWSASSTSIENTVEIPSIPKTERGLKFQTAAIELNSISDEFFELRNHNDRYTSTLENLKKEIKEYRSNFDNSDEISSSLAKDILKIARRIEYASIFPPNTLKGMEASIVSFDNIQKKEQGGLRWVDILLFPSGTIISSGPSCSEQGSGRWLPKPSDTINKFTLMLNPKVGFKQIPLIWYEMMDVSKIVGFILPDWIADILPGDYPVHTKEGVVNENFKGKVLKVVTGDFKMFKIPVIEDCSQAHGSEFDNTFNITDELTFTANYAMLRSGSDTYVTPFVYDAGRMLVLSDDPDPETSLADKDIFKRLLIDCQGALRRLDIDNGRCTERKNNFGAPINSWQLCLVYRVPSDYGEFFAHLGYSYKDPYFVNDALQVDARNMWDLSLIHI